MARLSITVTDQMKAWIDEQVASGRFADASAVIEDLVRRAMIREEKIANMQRLVDEARDSGLSSRTFDEIIADARKEALARLGKNAA